MFKGAESMVDLNDREVELLMDLIKMSIGMGGSLSKARILIEVYDKLKNSLEENSINQ